MTETEIPNYETKTIRVHEPEHGQYLYAMLTRFDGTETILGEIGYTGEYIQYQVMALNKAARVSDTDLHELARKHPSNLKETALFDLLYALDMGRLAWDTLSDGDHLTNTDVTALLAQEATA